MKVPALRRLGWSLYLCLNLVAGQTAYAHTPEIVTQKTERLRKLVTQNAKRLSGAQLDVLEDVLDRAIQDAQIQPPRPPRPGPGPAPGPGPMPGPGPVPRPPIPVPLPPVPIPVPQPASVCQLLGRGAHAGYTYNFRVALNGQTLEGSDNLPTELNRLTQLVSDRMCVMTYPDSCNLGARGAYAGYTYNFLVKRGNEVLAGSDNIDTQLSILSLLQNAGVCRADRTTQTCQLLPRGAYGGYTFNYRVGVGTEVMAASDDYNAIKAFIDKLRTNNVCY